MKRLFAVIFFLSMNMILFSQTETQYNGVNQTIMPIKSVPTNPQTGSPSPVNPPTPAVIGSPDGSNDFAQIDAEIQSAMPPPDLDQIEQNANVVITEEPNNSITPNAQGAVTADLPFSESSITEILAGIESAYGVKINAQGAVVNTGPITLLVEKATLEQALDKLVSPRDWVWEKVDAGTYNIWTRKDYETNVLPKKTIEKIFVIKYIDAEEVAKKLEGIKTKGIGTVAFDSRTNKVIVTDLAPVIEKIQRLLDEIDVKLVVRIFTIRDADVAEVAKKLESIKSPTGEIEVDERSHQIIVKDNFQNIKRMELMVEVLDVGTELKVFEVNSIFEDDLQNLQALVEKVITENALLEIDKRNGLLIVDDIPSVIDKVQKIVEAFDRPNKQVLIEAEVIEVKLSDDFTVGANYEVSGDMLAAIADGLFPNDGGNGLPIVPLVEEVTETDSEGNPTETELTSGFTNLRDEFPAASIGGDGASIQYMSKHLRAQLMASTKNTNVKMLLNPRIIAKNHQLATVDVGEEVPYLTTQASGDENNTLTSTQASLHAGLMLEVTPHISNNELIEMVISIKNDTASREEVPDGSGTQSLVSLQTQRAETTLIIPSGDTRVIGGLIKTSDTKTISGVPYLCKIPYIGPILFGSKSNSKVRNQLLIFITPTIVEEGVSVTEKEGIEKYEALSDHYEDIMNNPNTPDGLKSLDDTTTPTAENKSDELLSNETPQELPEDTTVNEEDEEISEEKYSSYEVQSSGLSGNISSVKTVQSDITTKSTNTTSKTPNVTTTPQSNQNQGNATPADPYISTPPYYPTKNAMETGGSSSPIMPPETHY